MAEAITHPFPAHLRTAQAWQIRQDCELPPMVGLVLLALVEHTGCKSGEAWPSIERLAEYTGLCERSIKRALKRLRALDIIEARPATLDGHIQKTVVYRLRFLTPDEAATVKPPADWPLDWQPILIKPDAALNAKGDTQSPQALNGKGDTQSPQGCQRVTPKVTHSHPKGDTQSPKPSIEPAIEQEKEQGKTYFPQNKTFSDRDRDTDTASPMPSGWLTAMVIDDIRKRQEGQPHAHMAG